MFELSEMIMVLSLVVAVFGLGYRIGRDKKNDENNKQKQPPRTAQTPGTATSVVNSKESQPFSRWHSFFCGLSVTLWKTFVNHNFKILLI